MESKLGVRHPGGGATTPVARPFASPPGLDKLGDPVRASLDHDVANSLAFGARASASQAQQSPEQTKLVLDRLNTTATLAQSALAGQRLLLRAHSALALRVRRLELTLDDESSAKYGEAELQMKEGVKPPKPRDMDRAFKDADMDQVSEG